MTKMKFSELIRNIGCMDFSNLEGRISYQKKMYFLEVFEAKEKTDFSWYHYGPYSPTATKLGFDFIERNINNEIEINEEKLNKFKDFMKECGLNSKFLELVASIHFLKFNEKKTKEEINEMISNKKQYLLIEQNFENSWSFVENHFPS